MIPALLLISSIICSSGRSLFSKRIKCSNTKAKGFFFCQFILFLFAGITAYFFDLKCFSHVSTQTVIYGLIYGILLIGSQWLFTVALLSGNLSTCSMVYSFGFIIPTVCGFIFWDEIPNGFNIIGVLLVIPLIIIVSTKDEHTKAKVHQKMVPLILSAICSGGLGVMQKIQGRSAYASEKTAFILIGCSLACLAGLISFLLVKKREGLSIRQITINESSLFSIFGGVCFGAGNMLNTILATMVASAVMFPILNIGVILLNIFLGFIVFKERLKIRDCIAFLMAVVSIVFLII